jgi:hypothetical protein
VEPVRRRRAPARGSMLTASTGAAASVSANMRTTAPCADAHLDASGANGDAGAGGSRGSRRPRSITPRYSRLPTGDGEEHRRGVDRLRGQLRLPLGATALRLRSRPTFATAITPLLVAANVVTRPMRSRPEGRPIRPRSTMAAASTDRATYGLGPSVSGRCCGAFRRCAAP